MKMYNLMILWLIMLLVLILFQNIGTLDTDSGDLDWVNKSQSDSGQGNVEIGDFSFSGGTLWDSLLHPTDWSAGFVYIILVLIAGAVVASFTLTSLLSQSFPTDTFLMAGWFGIMILFGAWPISLMFTFLRAELSSFMCAPGTGFCLMPVYISTIVAAVMLLTWVFTAIKHWRTGSD